VAGQLPIFGRPAMLGLHSTPTFILHFTNSFHPFPKFYLFIIIIIEIFYFILRNDESKYVVEKE
jgi:hypothetical protein